ncbi:hypothetical protein [Enterococcus casseliflavus]|uniref:hypothetical protein n=1 Tax=Enterococcus casseliflavus TaxID=37734 RepID=UPI003D6B5F63
MSLSAEIKELKVTCEYVQDTHELDAAVGSATIMLTVWDSHAIKQHDIEMTFEEWDIFKKIIDMAIARERSK